MLRESVGTQTVLGLVKHSTKCLEKGIYTQSQIY